MPHRLNSLEPGASVSEVARAAGLHVSQLFRWRKELCKRREASVAYPSDSGRLGGLPKGVSHVTIHRNSHMTNGRVEVITSVERRRRWSSSEKSNPACPFEPGRLEVSPLPRELLMPPRILPVIMCGGAGTRLWPVSRESMPKQFVRLVGQEIDISAGACAG